MPNIKSAKKRVNVNNSTPIEYKQFRKAYRESVNTFEVAIENKDKKAEELFRKAVSDIDKAWSKGVLKRNTADRKKASLAKLLSK